MSEITLNGPVVRSDAHNVVLRDALIHSPEDLPTSPTDHHKVDIGVRDGEFTSWIGSLDLSTDVVEAATPRSVLNSDRLGMRLKAGQAIVTRVQAIGTPASLKGSRINFRLGRVGGRYGPKKPLVSSGADAEDPNARTALAALEAQINNALSEWEESIQLVDPVELAPTGHFGGRLQVDSTSEISLQRYISNWVEVNGEAVSIGADGLTVSTSDKLLEATGEVGSTSVSGGSLYHIYVGNVGAVPQIRLSATGPTLHLGTYYLGTGPGADLWRFCGWAFYSDASEFVDSEIQRLLCNYYNRVLKDLYRTPGYADDNNQTTFTEANTAWVVANAGTENQVEFVSNAEDAVVIHATASVSNSGANTSELGIGIDSQASPDRVGIHGGTDIGNIALHYSEVLAVGWHTADMLTRVSGGTATYIADDDRNGAGVDPPVTYLSGQVLV